MCSSDHKCRVCDEFSYLPFDCPAHRSKWSLWVRFARSLGCWVSFDDSELGFHWFGHRIVSCVGKVATVCRKSSIILLNCKQANSGKWNSSEYFIRPGPSTDLWDGLVNIFTMNCRGIPPNEVIIRFLPVFLEPVHPWLYCLVSCAQIIEWKWPVEKACFRRVLVPVEWKIRDSDDESGDCFFKKTRLSNWAPNSVAPSNLVAADCRCR